jgi:hypothetical protein
VCADSMFSPIRTSMDQLSPYRGGKKVHQVSGSHRSISGQGRLPVMAAIQLSNCSVGSASLDIIPTVSLLSAKRYLAEEPVIKLAKRETFSLARPAPCQDGLVPDRPDGDSGTTRPFVVCPDGTSLARDIDEALVEASPFLDFMVRSGTISRRMRRRAEHRR